MLCERSIYDLYRDSRMPVQPTMMPYRASNPVPSHIHHHRPNPHHILQQQYLVQQQQRHQQQVLFQEQQILLQRQFYEQHVLAQRSLIKSQSLLAKQQNLSNKIDSRRRKSSTNSFSINAILGDKVENCKDGDTFEESRISSDGIRADKCSRIVRPWDDCSSSSSRNSTDNDVEDVTIDKGSPKKFGPKLTTKSGVSGSVKRSQQQPSNCPLDALFRMTSQTNFEGSTSGLLDYASDGSASHTDSLLGGGYSKSRNSLKKRRKTRTAFTNQQIYQLEKRFIYQKYLTPADRDEIALSLRLSNAQVITWFQNRRAKLKRDLEELKADVTAAKALGTEPSASVLQRLEELMKANEYGLKKKESGKSAEGGVTTQELTESDGVEETPENEDDVIESWEHDKPINDSIVECDNISNRLNISLENSSSQFSMDIEDCASDVDCDESMVS